MGSTPDSTPLYMGPRQNAALEMYNAAVSRHELAQLIIHTTYMGVTSEPVVVHSFTTQQLVGVDMIPLPPTTAPPFEVYQNEVQNGNIVGDVIE